MDHNINFDKLLSAKLLFLLNFTIAQLFLFHERKSEMIERKFEVQNPYLSHWVPEDWPHYIACTPAMLLILRQIGQFFKIHKKYCCRLGLVDNALLGMIKPKILPWNLTQALPREALIYLLQALLIILSTVCVTSLQVKFLYSEKATKFCEIFTTFVLCTYFSKSS